MRLPFACLVVLAVQCFRCDIVLELQRRFYPFYAEAEIPVPLLPSGWSMVDGFPLCPKHRVKLEATDAPL